MNKTDYTTLHCHSYDSTLDGLSSPTAIARRLVKTGGNTIAVTDHAVCSGIPGFFKAMSDACGFCGNPKASHRDGKGKCMVFGEKCEEFQKSKLKPIAGLEFNVPFKNANLREPTNRAYSHLVVLAKNQAGWKGLVGASSESNRPENFYYKPRLHLEKLGEFAAGNWVAFSGHPGSTLANFIFDDYKLAYRSKTYEEAKSFVKDWNVLKHTLIEEIKRHEEFFGKGNFFIEIQLLDAENMPAAQVIANILRWASKESGVPSICTPDAHYPTRADAPDQRILLCSSLKTSLRKVAERAEAGEDVTLGGFFKSNNYHIPTPEEMFKLHTKEELANTVLIGEMIEPFTLLGKPRLPKFPCPNGLSEPQYVREVCKEGWAELIDGEISKDKQDEYRARLDSELKVFDKHSILHSYFLIMSDICKYSVRELGSPLSEGRGSASGTLIGYLMRLHDSDPIEGGLSFERFFNESRSTPEKPSMPDIDLDFPTAHREPVIQYIKDKYGADRVAKIATFSELQGREALTTVLGAHEWGDYKERKELTKLIPSEAEISDKLQEMVEEMGESSIIKWTLLNEPDIVSQYCTIGENGELSGPLAPMFGQAMRLENCRRGRGTHASGVIISDAPLADICPMIYDEKNDDILAGFSFPDLESMGLMKCDILGISMMDKMLGIYETLRTGEV